MWIYALASLLWAACVFLLSWFALGPQWAWTAAAFALWVWVLVQLGRAWQLEQWLKRMGEGEPPRLSGLWREIADRTRRVLRQREQQAASSADRLHNFLAAIQASPNGVIFLDKEGRIEWCNETASHHLGLDPQRDRQQHVVHLVRDPVFSRYFAQVAHDSEVVIDGRTASLSQSLKLSVQLHPYGEGQQLMLTRDITSLSQADVMRRDFVANVSHEIRTPLTVLAGFVETLQSLDLPPQEQKSYLDVMATQAQRMQTLVSDLLTLSQLEGSPPPSTHELVPLQSLLAQLVAEGRALSAVNAGDGAEPVHPMDFSMDHPCSLMGARAELFSAFSNLVSNAVRYTPAGGQIHIGWRVHSDGSGVFSVKDAGPGIAAEHLPRLAERFYRVDRSRSSETGGAGLGLAIAKHVAFRHGGDLRIQSKPGQGSTFELWFPPGRLVSTPDLR